MRESERTSKRFEEMATVVDVIGGNGNNATEASEETAVSRAEEAELLDAYNDGTIIETRLSRMLGNGQLELVDGHYRLRSHTLVRMAYFFLTLKWVLLRRSSEFSQ